MNNAFSISCPHKGKKILINKIRKTMRIEKSSGQKSYFLTPLLLLCLLLFVNGCTGKKLTTEQLDPALELEELQEKEEGEKQKEEEQKEAKDELKEKVTGEQQEKKKEKKRWWNKKRWTKKKRNKAPATQRPYVIKGQTYFPIPTAEGYEETGLASWYGDPFHGRKTANGETYDMHGVTAAHKTLPMDTMLLVKNLANSKTTIVRINDRGPFVDGRIIDLSYTTAKELGIVRNGTEKVQIVALCAVENQEPERKAGSKFARKKKRNSKERGEVPILTARNKKKDATAPTRVTGTMCMVIRPNGQKQRIQQDFDKGNFYIQVGSFEKKKRARKLAKTFAAQGRDVIIQKFAAAGTNLFRVLVYSSTSLKKAKKHHEKLKEQGFEHAFVIARDKKKQGGRKIIEKLAAVR
ncbi:MAG: septal ring lytic transglycosylase RlpA family protein [Candidatus Electrothrix sp. ATG2]|nr:septal ring lytic transglycosylase RlpA family protein [Candidatus Electrothrix sp. ATG2]